MPSPPLALFILILPQAHLTLDSRMSGSRWVIIPSWVFGSLRSFLYGFSVYSHHLFFISSASVRSLPFLSFIFILFYFIFIFLFVVNFAIHWNEKALGLHVFPIPIPLPTSLSTHSLQVFPQHQVRALVSCIQPGLVICFTLDGIHILILFSWNIPPSPSPTESKILFYKSVSLFLFCI